MKKFLLLFFVFLFCLNVFTATPPLFGYDYELIPDNNLIKIDYETHSFPFPRIFNSSDSDIVLTNFYLNGKEVFLKWDTRFRYGISPKIIEPEVNSLRMIFSEEKIKMIIPPNESFETYLWDSELNKFGFNKRTEITDFKIKGENILIQGKINHGITTPMGKLVLNLLFLSLLFFMFSGVLFFLSKTKFKNNQLIMVISFLLFLFGFLAFLFIFLLGFIAA